MWKPQARQSIIRQNNINWLSNYILHNKIVSAHFARCKSEKITEKSNLIRNRNRSLLNLKMIGSFWVHQSNCRCIKLKTYSTDYFFEIIRNRIGLLVVTFSMTWPFNSLIYPRPCAFESNRKQLQKVAFGFRKFFFDCILSRNLWLLHFNILYSIQLRALACQIPALFSVSRYPANNYSDVEKKIGSSWHCSALWGGLMVNVFPR